MKKAVLPLLLLCLTQGISAQEAKPEKPEQDFNKWTLELGGGINTVSNPLSAGYDVSGYNLFNGNFGARYMFNTKFGLKLTGTYDRLQNNDRSPEFKTNVIGVSLQGVVNLGRILDFQTWTNRLNLLGHAGVGVSQFDNDDIKDPDRLGNFLFGLTGQFKISERVSLFGDFTMTNSFSQQLTWNGGAYDPGTKQGFDSSLYAASIGITVALGKHAQHADWYIVEPDAKILDDLESRIGDLETMMNDTDKDGVPDYLDTEPNTIAGVAVDTKGRSIDKNENGIPDELESYIEQNNTALKNGMSADIADLINGGYVNVYFDTNKDLPTQSSVNGINFLIKFLKDNPSKSADVVGYADEIGSPEYNKELSARRANNVKQILVDAGIEASRLNILGNGEDNSVNKSSTYARQTVRRVTFTIK